MFTPRCLNENGNLIGPGYQNMLNWLGQVWSKLPRDINEPSFLHCGIGEREPIMYHSTLRDIIMDQSIPQFGEEIVEEFCIPDDESIPKDQLFVNTHKKLDRSNNSKQI